MEDAPMLVKAANWPAIARNMENFPSPFRMSDALDWIESMRLPAPQLTEMKFAVFLGETNEIVGGVALVDINRKNGSAELSYWCTPAYWGNGYATEASKRLLQYAFEVLELVVVRATCFADNTASRRVMEKIGMTFRGTQRKSLRSSGALEDLLIYTITLKDWKRQQER